MAREPRELVTIPDENPSISYVVGATADDTFTFPFPYWDSDDIAVYTSDGATTTLRLDVTITPATGFAQTGYASGSVVFNAPVSNVTVIIKREGTFNRLNNLPPGQAVDMFALNRDINRIIGLLQTLRMKIETGEGVDSDLQAQIDALILDTTTAWGEIIGTLSDQTDLQAALDAKEDAHEHPYLPLAGGIMLANIGRDAAGPHVWYADGTYTSGQIIVSESDPTGAEPDGTIWLKIEPVA